MKLVLLSQKGGVGKSTLALSIAYYWHARGREVLLVDADPQGTCRIAGDVSKEKSLPYPAVMGMGPGLHRANELPKFAQAYEDVVIDTPAGTGEVQSSALQVADVALIPVAPGLDAWSVAKTVELVKKAGRKDLKAALVVARKVPRTSLGRDARAVLEAAELPLFKAETSNRMAWAEAPLSGKGLAEYAPKSAAAEELESLIQELKQFARKK